MCWQTNLDSEAVARSWLSIMRLLACLRVVLEILLRSSLTVAGGLSSLTASGASLRDILCRLVELYLAVLAHEGVRALRLGRDIVGEVVMNLSSLRLLVVLVFGATHACRPGHAWSVATGLSPWSILILICIRPLPGGLPVLRMRFLKFVSCR